VALNLLRALDSAPSWVGKTVDSVLAGHGIAGAAYDRIAHPYTKRDIPTLPAPLSAPVRLLIGPANEAEQGYQWARAFERELPEVAAVAMMGIDPGGYAVRANLPVPTGVYLRSPTWRRAFDRYAEGCTHILLESGLRILGRGYTNAGAEVRHFRDRAVQVGAIFHGSDLRLPSQHMQESEWSPFRDAEIPSRLLEKKAAANIDLVKQLGLPAFVSTPDLVHFLPGSIWCPVVIEPDEWKTEREQWPRSRPVVLHAPSNPVIKGSVQIEPLLHALHAERVIEYRQVAGLKHEEMKQQYAAADIVLDQFLIGSYGVAACEALAAGCLVIGHVDDQTRGIVRDETGSELPIVEATVESLGSVLRAIATEPASFASTRLAGADFVARVHSGHRSAEAVRDFLGLGRAKA
jgi:hypothetical protein